MTFSVELIYFGTIYCNGEGQIWLILLHGGKDIGSNWCKYIKMCLLQLDNPDEQAAQIRRELDGRLQMADQFTKVSVPISNSYTWSCCMLSFLGL